jgi:hypothetical protein
MVRRVLTQAEEDRSRASDRLREMVGARSRKKRSARTSGPSESKVHAKVAELKEKVFDQENWKNFGPEDMVAMFLFLHEEVYGVSAVPETVGQNFLGARSAAAALAKRLGTEETVDFIRWTWSREQEREEWCRKNGKERGRISWRLQFSNNLVVDYKVQLARAAGDG